MDYDLIVVGSGSVGSAAGYYATQAGLRVLMIDSAMPPHQAASHHGETRIIRHAYGEGERYVPMVLRAQQLWNELDALTEEQLFHQCGVLNIGHRHSEFIRNVQESAQKFALNVQSLDAAQVEEKWPVFTLPEDFIGVFEPQSGFLQCEKAIKTLITLAREAGCAQLFNCAVTDITDDGTQVSVTTPEGIYTARKVAVTAGTWVKTLFPELPVQPVRKVFSWHQADGRYSEENHFPAFTAETPDDDQFYGFPAGKDGLKLGKHNGGQVIERPEQRKAFGRVTSDGTEVFNFLRNFLPGIGGCLRGAACTYDLTSDEDFIIDTLPERVNTLIITGLSGHGFKFSTVLGEIVTQFAQDKESSFDLSPFRLSRFN